MAIQDHSLNNLAIARGLIEDGTSADINKRAKKLGTQYSEKQAEVQKRTATSFAASNTGGFLTDVGNQLTRSPAGESPVMVFTESEPSAPPTSEVGSKSTSTFVSSLEELEYEMGSAQRDITEMIVHWSETMTHANLTGDQLEELTGAGTNAFHYIIRRDGSVERGVPLESSGDHTTGHNKYSIGVCLVGGVRASHVDTRGTVEERITEDSMTRSQYNTLNHLFRVFFSQYPGAQALGHNEVDPSQNGPGFKVSRYVETLFGKKSVYEDPSTESEKSPTDILAGK